MASNLNFPASPVDGQQYILNGIQYYYSVSVGAWLTYNMSNPYAANSSNLQIFFNDAGYSNGSYGLLFDRQANTFSTNTVIAGAYAGAGANLINTAFNVANAAFGKANTGSGVTSIANGVGLNGGTITTTGTLSLQPAGAGAASYSSGISALTVDAYGRVTAITGSAGYLTGITSSQVTTALGYTPPQPGGTGASGTWGISITGNAATVGGYTPSASSGTANRVVLADGNGYIFNNYFNSTDNSQTSGVSALMCKAGDNYYRSATAAAVAAFISGQSMNISGTSTNITAYTINQNLGTGNGPTFTEIYNSGWFRNNAANQGHYNQATSRGIWDPSNAGYGSYGNMSTYGAGLNGWQGWAIPGTFHFMGRSGTDFGLYDSQSGHWIIYAPYNTGYMGLNSSATSSSYSVYVSGSLYATSDIISGSDARIKENVITIDNALNRVLQMRGVFYNKIINPVEKLQGKRELGVIAQEVLPILPEAVTYDEDNDRYGVTYPNMVGLLIEAIKDQQKIINEMKEEIKILKEVK